MIFVNHNSFIILSVFFWVVTVFALRQRGWTKQSWVILGGVTALLAVGYSAFRPASATSDQALEIRARIGQGTPVLLEMQSQN